MSIYEFLSSEKKTEIQTEFREEIQAPNRKKNATD